MADLATDIFGQDLVLPGTITQIQSEYENGYDASEFGTTKPVIVVGTAFDGPVGRLIASYSPTYGKYVFGPTYDPVSKRKATLVTGIQDAYERGARTIYAVRCSGTPIYKDYQLIKESTLKLRVSGFFPSNANKDVYMVVDNASDDIEIKIYKPSNRATIQEKMQGYVNSDSSILVNTIYLTSNYGITKESGITELIDTVNKNAQNNVIKLSVVDSSGVDVTNDIEKVSEVLVGDLFPGLYTIGRSKSLCAIATDLEYAITTSTNKPYSSFDGLIFKKLVMNTDVSTDIPIYGTLKDLNLKFSESGLQMSTLFDFLEIQGQIDYLFEKDSVDYEQVNISNFDMYKLLGSGFAITAKAVYKNGNVGKVVLNNLSKKYVDTVSGIKLSAMQSEMTITIGMNITKLANDAISPYSIIDIYDNAGNLVNDPALSPTVDSILAAINTSGHGQDIRVIETSVSDSNRVVSLTDGIYSMLENVQAEYRIITNVNADDEIINKIPRKADFEKAAAYELIVFDDNVIAKAVIDPDAKLAKKTYKFRLTNYTPSATDIELGLNTDFVAKEISIYDEPYVISTILKKGSMAQSYEEGSLFLCRKYDSSTNSFMTGVYELYKYYNGEFMVQNDASLYDNLIGKYLFANNVLYVGSKNGTLIEFKPVQTKASISAAAFDYIMVESKGSVYVYNIAESTTAGVSSLYFTGVGEISQAIDDTTDRTLVTIQSSYLTDNIITINTNEYDYLTLTDFVNILNENEYINRLFEFSVNTMFDATKKDMYLSELNIVTEPFDDTKVYTTGAKVLFNNVLYKAVQNIAAGPFDATKWICNFDEKLGFVSGQIVVYNGLYYKASINMAPGAFNSSNWTVIGNFSTASNYAAGDPAVQNNVLYIAKVPVSSGAAFDGTQWSAVTVDDAVEVSYEDSDIQYNTTLYIPFKTTDTFDRHLAQHCTYTALKTYPTHGVIGTKLITDVGNPNAIAKKASEVVGLRHIICAKKGNGNDMLDKNNNQYMIGKNISVVAGPQYTVDTLDGYSITVNGAAGYAGFISQLTLDQSSTSQPINIPTPAYDFTSTQLTSLTQSGFITFSNTFTKGYVVTDGVTQDQFGATFSRLLTTRTMNEVERQIKIGAEPYLGKINHPVNRNALYSAIKSRLDKMVDKYIKYITIAVRVDKAAEKIGAIYIDYDTEPMYEIKQIINTVQVKEQQTG